MRTASFGLPLLDRGHCGYTVQLTVSQDVQSMKSGYKISHIVGYVLLAVAIIDDGKKVVGQQTGLEMGSASRVLLVWDCGYSRVGGSCRLGIERWYRKALLQPLSRRCQSLSERLC